MKLKFTLLAVVILLIIQSHAQTGVAINTTGAEPANSAMLDVSSTEKGILIPRMTEAQRTAIVSPATGLLVYQNDGSEGFYYYGGSAWKRLDTGSISGITGTSPILSSGGTTPLISISEATTSAAGSMSAADKTKLDAISGTNTGNQTITLTGDVTGSGTGSFAATISSAAVNNSKLENMAANTIKVNNTASSATPSDLSITANTFPARSSSGNLTAKPVTDYGLSILDDTNADAVRTTIGAGTGNGTVTSVSGTAPINVTTGSSTPLISISGATTSAAGSMSATDKTKLDAQTTGTSAGQMQYWNGTSWVTVATGQSGQILKFRNGMPNWEDDNINNLSLGDFYRGGFIVYFLQDGDPGYDLQVRHGIIAAPNDLSGYIPWGCEGTSIPGAHGDAIGTGMQNTLAILDSCETAGIAAQLCNDLVLNGYDDWFLPSRFEMYKLNLNKDYVPNLATTWNPYYWTSSEYNSHEARAMWIGNGSSNLAQSKNYGYRVRPVRWF